MFKIFFLQKKLTVFWGEGIFFKRAREKFFVTDRSSQYNWS